MAYDALYSLANDLDELLDHRFCRFCNFTRNTEQCILVQKKQRIQRLHGNIIFLLNFVGGFDKLEARVTKAANQAKNMIRNRLLVDERVESGEGLIVSFKKMFCCPKLEKLSYNKMFCLELEKLIAETDFIREEAKQIGSSRRIPMPSGNDTVFGIEEDLLEMKSRLCEGLSDLGIIPIVGMGGIGKTTLARYVYNDPLSVQHFDVRVCVTISQTYDLREILVIVLRSIKNVFRNRAGEENWDGMTDELLKENVYRYLKGRRYLIFIDDMWDAKLWDDLQVMFPNDLNGSRIIITTRELNVASYIDSLSRPHEMRLMSVDQSWRLLKNKVFGEEDCPLELEKIGEVVAEKCRGLPLAIVLIAGVLSCMVDQTNDSWEKIAANVSKVLSTDDEQIIEILSLSYEYLPRHLRPCFLCMGFFPEDFEINVSKLIRLWAAEGFLASDDSKHMEELGYEYLEDLATRSLVLINKKGYDGKIRTVKIHDLLRDLCLRKCRDENFLCTITDFSGSFPQGIENSNRLSVFCNVSGCVPGMESSPLQTIILFKNWALDSLINFRLVRVFDGLSVTLKSSSSVVFIGQLIHLRYLALTCEPDPEMLELVSKNFHCLHNLQTLVFRILRRFRRFLSQVTSQASFRMDQDFLDFELWRMPQLRHLILLDGFLPQPPAEISGSMENLQTLFRMKNFECSERFLELIPNLKKLGIVYSYAGTYETGWSQYGLKNLVNLRRLEKLNLYAEPYPYLKDDLSQNIAFPMTLKKLSLSGCRFPWEDMRMIGLLPNLEVLKLKRRACYGTEWETREGDFCQLKVLLIDSTDLSRWTTESSPFPKLEHLTLYQCDKLMEIPYDIGEISTLELIEVDIRNSSMVESAKCIEEEQQSQGNIDLHVRFLKSRSWATTSWF